MNELTIPIWVINSISAEHRKDFIDMLLVEYGFDLSKEIMTISDHTNEATIYQQVIDQPLERVTITGKLIL